jgi:two-component system sensor histidine kinase KdpD
MGLQYEPEVISPVGRRALRLFLSIAGVALVTFAARYVASVNATTAGFAYLLLVLLIAVTWGFVEASISSVIATLAYNFNFLPPVGTFTIADPHNWIALFSFLTTSLIASRLSTEARRRALEALARQADLERLYTFSRAILLIEGDASFPKQLVRQLAEIFQLEAVVLFDRRSDEFHRAGPSDFEGLEDQLRDAALQGTSFADPTRNRVITAVRLGSEPIAGLAVQGAQMPDSVLQGIANLVAIGLERARAQELTAQIDAAKESEKLRTTLLDAMAHEFKTPLTSVLAATTSLRDNPDQARETRVELVNIADEEARRLEELITDAVEMGRLDTADIRLNLELTNVSKLVKDLVQSMQRGIENRPVKVVDEDHVPPVAIDQRLMKLAIKQLIDNALKYSPPDNPVTIRVGNSDGMIAVAITDHGKGIPVHEQGRVFERLYRSPAIQRSIPGSGLGLSIAQSIVQAHHGDLNVTSRPGETTFRLRLPLQEGGERN